MKEEKNILSQVSTSGKVAWRSPSNIALVKYWGKKGFQLPANPSLSMTLDSSVTEMEFDYSILKEGEGLYLDFYFEGKKEAVFEEKIRSFLSGLLPGRPYLKDIHIVLKSRNTFPHSAGIASSASSMSALALCLVSLEQQLSGSSAGEGEFYMDASNLARQASGSACRSLYGGYNLWGKIQDVEGSSDEYAIMVTGGVHPSFHDMRDAILVVSTEGKKVSSRAGHGLMKDHPFAAARYEMARSNVREMLNAMQTGEMEAFVRIVEQEALTLHAMMMTSPSPFILLRPNSLALMEKIRQFREETGVPACFTIDAGPNIHLLYPGIYQEKVKGFIRNELESYLQGGRWIDDSMGSGPVNLNM